MLWCTGRVPLRSVQSSWTRDQTRVPCTGRQIPSIGPPGKSDSNFKTSIKCYIKYLKELIVREEVWEEFINQIVREEQRRMEVKGV